MQDDDGGAWLMYTYKVAPCPAKERHDWSSCPFAHRGERAARRCPRTHTYSADPCPEYSKKGSCPRGDACTLAHGVFEGWLHPSRFRTQLCCFGSSCKRRICFFAHSAAQLRTPTSGSLPPQASSANVMRRTLAVVPAAAIGLPGSSAAAGLMQGGSQGMAALQQQRQQQQQQQQQAQAYAASSATGGGMLGAGWVFTAQGWAPATYALEAAAAEQAGMGGGGAGSSQFGLPAASSPAAAAAASIGGILPLSQHLDQLLQDPLQSRVPQGAASQVASMLPGPYGSYSLAAMSQQAQQQQQQVFESGLAEQLHADLCLPLPGSSDGGMASAAAAAAAAAAAYQCMGLTVPLQGQDAQQFYEQQQLRQQQQKQLDEQQQRRRP